MRCLLCVSEIVGRDSYGINQQSSPEHFIHSLRLV